MKLQRIVPRIVVKGSVKRMIIVFDIEGVNQMGEEEVIHIFVTRFVVFKL